MLSGKTVLITGAARRLGREFALACAAAGADLVIHYSSSKADAEKVSLEISALGRQVELIQADFSQLEQVQRMIAEIWPKRQIDILINNAAIFDNTSVHTTSLDTWQTHININLTVPFLLSQAFAAHFSSQYTGRIVNILDWRALRPGKDHFPYTISKSALAAMTRSLAAELAPNILVNGLALGAILPPADGSQAAGVLNNVPARRWARVEEVTDALLFLIDGPEYITGEILHVDGGRHII